MFHLRSETVFPITIRFSVFIREKRRGGERERDGEAGREREGEREGERGSEKEEERERGIERERGRAREGQRGREGGGERERERERGRESEKEGESEIEREIVCHGICAPFRTTASKRGRNNLKGLEDFYLKAKDRICPMFAELTRERIQLPQGYLAHKKHSPT